VNDIALIRQALKAAQLSLEWVNGCWATDRPDLLRGTDESIPLDEILWQGNECRELESIKQALAALDRMEGVNGSGNAP
jgi:hypothetical protein